MKRFAPLRMQGGFSLIEVLVAAAVLSVGLLALASLQMSIVRTSSDSKAYSVALSLAKDKLEDGVEAVKDRVDDAFDRGEDGSEDLGERVRDTSNSAGRNIKEAGRDLGDAVKRAGRKVDDKLD